MEFTQVFELVNQTTQEILGETGVVKEDLSNVVDIGEEIFNANALDKYVKALVNRIGKVIFVNRVYSGSLPKVLMDGWEYGSVLEKIQMDMPDAVENPTWALENGTSYDPNVFNAPVISAKFFNKRVTFEVDISITEKQVKQSFTNGTQLNAFVSMIYNGVDKSMTVKIESLTMRTINNAIAATAYDDFPTANYTEASGVKAVNLLKLYNTLKGGKLTVDKAMQDLDFLKFASKEIGLYISRMGRMSTLFNIGKKERFTPRDMLHVVMLSDFAKASEVYLQSNTYHNELVKLPNYEEVPYWQGSGTSYAFGDVSKIDVKTAASSHPSKPSQNVTLSGILCVLFDRDALGVCNYDRRVTSDYNAKAEFYNNFYKFDCGYFNDLNENFVVFFIA